MRFEITIKRKNENSNFTSKKQTATWFHSNTKSYNTVLFTVLVTHNDSSFSSGQPVKLFEKRHWCMNNKSRNIESLLDTVVSSKMLIGYLGFCNRLGSAICSKCLTPKFSSSVPLSSPFNSNIKIANFLTVSQP